MSAARRALAVASLLVLVCTTGGQQPTQCSEDLYGSDTGRLVELADVPMPAGVTDPVVPPIASDACPPGTVHFGTRLRACDADVRPYVKLRDLDRASVHRNGDVEQQGTIKVMLFCPPDNL